MTALHHVAAADLVGASGAVVGLSVAPGSSRAALSRARAGGGERSLGSVTVLPAAIATLLDGLAPSSTHHDAARLLRRAGWTPCGAGDWAFALAAPDAEIVARISPFDPAGPYTARLYREAALTRLVPHLYRHQRLQGGGDLQILEKLWPSGQHEATAFLAELAEPSTNLASLAAVVARVHALARRELPWCGPLDTNPSNVMRARAGRLVLTDPYYADGPSLYATAEQHPDVLVAAIPERERRYLTEIPLAASGPWPQDARESMRASLRLADERLSETSAQRQSPPAPIAVPMDVGGHPRRG